jgi:hypothetical protein
VDSVKHLPGGVEMKNYLLTVVFLCTAVSASSYAGQSDPPKPLEVTLPSLPWRLVLDAPGFTQRINEIQQGGRRYFLADSDTNHFAVSVFLEPTATSPPPGECERSLKATAARNVPASTTPLPGVRYRKNGDMQILEYTLSSEGVPLKQRNIFACIPREDAYIDIHISKVLFTDADQPAVDKLLQSFRIVPRDSSAAVASTTDGAVDSGAGRQLFLEGSRAFRDGKYQESIAPYQKALDLEKASPKLEKTLWLALIDNLTMAYGITGNFAASQATAQYGVSEDPAYPLFYYNLACAAAEQGNVADTQNFLKLAYDRRGNMIPGEKFPDARTDDSFATLMKNPDFRGFVNALYSNQK